MNNTAFLHIVERLEGFLGKLPESIQKPILSELTPLKQLFLQQRSPRFVLCGSHPMPLLDFAARLFTEPQASEPAREILTGLFRWQKVTLGHHGSVQLLDARGADETALELVCTELRDQPADVFFFLPAERSAKTATRKEIDRLEQLLGCSKQSVAPRLIELRPNEDASSILAGVESPEIRAAFIGMESLGPLLRRTLTHALPNEAQVEMVRLTGERETQNEMAERLVKSTTAICAAIGAQPIPLADLPILTTLQLVMVAGIMYITGRERSLRAATEFLGALGVNVGAGMILREGSRALLKFFPGWGNVLCGMIAGAGTYAIGRAAMAYLIEGVSLPDARRVFLRSKKERTSRARLSGSRTKALLNGE